MNNWAEQGVQQPQVSPANILKKLDLSKLFSEDDEMKRERSEESLGARLNKPQHLPVTDQYINTVVRKTLKQARSPLNSKARLKFVLKQN